MTNTKIKNIGHNPENQAARQNIVDAAIRLFKKNGTQKTSMLAIAKEAGISRKTLYRVFDRPTMIEAILQVRLNQMSNKTRLKIRKYSNIEEALVEGSIASIAIARRDTLFTQIVMEETDHQIELFLIRGTDKVKEGLYDIWAPLIEKGRIDGEIRANLTNNRIIELIMNAHCILRIRDDLSLKEQKQFLNDMLVPTILKK